jgi:hypothetical protein
MDPAPLIIKLRRQMRQVNTTHPGRRRTLR